MRAYERLLKYAVIDTQSDAGTGTHPSTAKQLNLAKLLLAELLEIGAAAAKLDEHGYVYATIPASKGAENKPVLALLAHMDTAPDASGTNVKPHIVQAYDGGDIVLNAEKGIVTKVSDFPDLKKYIGKDIIVTDGTTLLGADDKAGVAEIMTLAETLLSDDGKDIPHPEIRIVFTPDEEIGEGVATIDMNEVNAAYGYTVDGGEIGELCYENFNAASARIVLHGVCVHPGAAFGIMRNASLLAMEYHAMLPAFENPATTVGRMGFFHLTQMEGCMEEASLNYILRDHDAARLEARKELILKAAEYLNLKYGAGTAIAEIKDSYRNMYEQIVPAHTNLITSAREAMQELGITPIEEPIRGGTDGATLSYMGLPCPNLGTGGHAFHGVHEFIPIQSMDKTVEMLKALVRRFA